MHKHHNHEPPYVEETKTTYLIGTRIYYTKAHSTLVTDITFYDAVDDKYQVPDDYRNRTNDVSSHFFPLNENW